jgi:Cytochrome C biogenesis protein transmembrane region
MHFIGGALMGLAGSLHCAGLCGGIASSLLLATEAPDGAPAARAARLLKVQLGRALSYTLCGAMVGGGGAAFAGLINLAGIQPMTRIAAACALVWTGCSVAGLVPSFAILDRVMASTFNSWPVAVTRQFQNPHPVVLGILWGFAPCGVQRHSERFIGGGRELHGRLRAGNDSGRGNGGLWRDGAGGLRGPSAAQQAPRRIGNSAPYAGIGEPRRTRGIVLGPVPRSLITARRVHSRPASSGRNKVMGPRSAQISFARSSFLIFLPPSD